MDLNQLSYKFVVFLKRVFSRLASWYRRVRDRLLRYFVPNDDDGDSTHVTTSNLEQHRKQILEQARRHVKPQTATNSNVVRNSVVVGVISILLVVIGLYFSVFRLQPTNNFYYRVSQILPMPVGEIVDRNIMYDRVLFYYRAESRADDFDLTQSAATDADSKADRLQRSFLNAREAVYFERLAEAQQVEVSDEEVEAIISDLPLLDSGTTDLDVVLQQFRGWTRDDLFRETRLEALKSSKLVPEQLHELTVVTDAGEFEAQASKLKEQGAKTGKISDIEKPDDALTLATRKLAEGESSGLIQAEDAVYILFKVEKNVRYVSVAPALRVVLLEQQAAEAASRSCLHGVDFSDTNLVITSEARYSSCLF